MAQGQQKMVASNVPGGPLTPLLRSAPLPPGARSNGWSFGLKVDQQIEPEAQEHHRRTAFSGSRQPPGETNASVTQHHFSRQREITTPCAPETQPSVMATCQPVYTEF